MNEVLKTLFERKSVRVFEDKPIPEDIKELILKAAMRAPTAGNMMLYTVIEITDQTIKDTLAKTCDNQPFIAKAPLVLLFLADYQKWYDYYNYCGVKEICEEMGMEMRKPGLGDLFLACSDALIAAQNAVIAAESLGIGSCYIGDIMENYEIHKELFALPPYTFPIALLCFGYPTEQQKRRERTKRFSKEYVVFKNRYKRLTKEELDKMFEERNKTLPEGPYKNYGQLNFFKKFNADFAIEMNRSVREIIKNWG